jgi:hypothetical protein
VATKRAHRYQGRANEPAAQGNWQIDAHFPGAEIRYITGLMDKADIDDWMGGSRKIAWLRSQGYAK